MQKIVHFMVWTNKGLDKKIAEFNSQGWKVVSLTKDPRKSGLLFEFYYDAILEKEDK